MCHVLSTTVMDLQYYVLINSQLGILKPITSKINKKKSCNFKTNKK